MTDPATPINYDEVYPPAEDTFLLLRAALAEARAGDSVLEIGCGSGLVSQELAPFVASLLATDINPHAVRAARARGVEVIRADLFKGDQRKVRPDTLQRTVSSHQARGEGRPVDGPLH